MSRLVPAALAALAAAVFAVPAIRHWRERPPEPPSAPPPLRSTWLPPDNLAIGAGTDFAFGLALAPDGRQIAFPAARGDEIALWLQDLRTGSVRQLPGTGSAAAPFWSPDGARVGFFAAGRLRVFALDDGTVSDVADAPSPRGASWNAAGDLVFAATATGGLSARRADQSLATLTTVDSAHREMGHHWPAFLPDGRHVVFLVTATDRARAGIWIVSLDQPAARRRLIAADAQAIVVGSSLLLLNDQTLVSQALAPETWEPTGRSTLAGVPVGRGPLGQVFATATADVLLYGAPGTPLRDLLWVDREGSRIARASEPVDAWDLRLAPDGRRAAVTEMDPQLRTFDIFIRTGSQPIPTRLSPSTDSDDSGVWSPDGLRVAWVNRRGTITIRGAGAVLPEQTIATYDAPVQVWDWSRDGRALLIGRTAAASGDDLWIQPPIEGRTAEPYVTSAFNQTFGAFSPDGRWVAYASDESGKFDIYVDSFPKTGTRIRVTTAGGTEPRWQRDGRELYYRRGSEFHAATLAATAGGIEVRALDRLFDAAATLRSYDAAPDGSRFLINVPASSAASRPTTMIHHWQTR